MFAIAAIFGGSFTLALSGALMPGPLLTVTISESARRGFRAGPLLMIGHSLLELVLVIAVIQGLGPYLKSPIVMGIISLFGGGVRESWGRTSLYNFQQLTTSLAQSPRTVDIDATIYGFVNFRSHMTFFII